MITLIAAIDKNRGLGVDNSLLCHLPSDLAHFKSVTTSGETNCILMGRRTYESIGKPLPNRINLILTRDKSYKAPARCHVYSDLQKVLKEYENYGEGKVNLFIIGGGDIFNQTIQYADKIELTIIDNYFEDVDCYFPEFSLDEWKPVSYIKRERDEKNPFDHYFITYVRR